MLNGPNLNLLGSREPEIYGNESIEAYFEKLRNRFPDIELTHHQTNHEGNLVDHLQEAPFYAHGIVLNAGGYTHTSVAIRDAISAIHLPVVEVHISNILAREGFRATSYLAPVCQGTITGFGLAGYDLAIRSFLSRYNAPSE